MIGFSFWPSRLAIMLPILASIFQWLTRGRFSRQVRLTLTVVVILLTVGLALFHVLAMRQLSCMFLGDSGNCFVSALGSLTTSLLLIGLVVLLLRQKVKLKQTAEFNHARLLLFVASFAGVTLGENLLIVILSLLGIYASLDYWLRHRGLRWGFLVIRDDYKGDIN